LENVLPTIQPVGPGPVWRTAGAASCIGDLFSGAL